MMIFPIYLYLPIIFPFSSCISYRKALVPPRLASYHQARRGQSFAFTDVEGMVRRSRLLSSDAMPKAVGALERLVLICGCPFIHLYKLGI